MPGTPKSLKNTVIITKTICVLLCFQSFLCAKQSFLTRVIFIQGAFKNIQGLLWKIQGIFKGIAQVFIFQGLSKDIMLFQGLFQGLCEPCYRVRKRAVTKGLTLGISPGYYEHDHRLFSCKCPQSSFIHSKTSRYSCNTAPIVVRFSLLVFSCLKFKTFFSHLLQS